MNFTSVIGRKNLYVDVKEVTSENIIEVIAAVEPDFLSNQQDCDRLLVIDSGKMPLQRQKVVRPEIDIQTVDNIANEISTFKIGFHWGNVITLVQRGLKDGGSAGENEGITLLNECYAAENIGKKQRQLGYYVEICGIGYSYVNINPDWVEGDSYFQVETLDPRFAFVVRSSIYTDHRVILGVSFRTDNQGNTYYTAFTKNARYEIAGGKVVSVTRNPIGVIPIIEWERSSDRMGVFEREIPEMDRLNLMLSDIANDIDQECQMIWHSNDVSFPHVKDENGNDTDEIERPKSGEWISTETAKDGKTPFIKPLATNYNYAGLLSNYTSARTMILERTYTPQRNDNSGGSTGTAMSDATGWSAAEQVACSQQLLMEGSKLDEVRVALAVIKASDARVPLDSPLRKLKVVDCAARVIRQKTYELATKTTAFATLLSHGVYGLHAMNAVSLFSDVTQVWEDSKDLIEEYQKKTFGEEKEAKPSSDNPIYQIGNSPIIDGTGKEQPKVDADGSFSAG